MYLKSTDDGFQPYSALLSEKPNCIIATLKEKKKRKKNGENHFFSRIARRMDRANNFTHHTPFSTPMLMVHLTLIKGGPCSIWWAPRARSTVIVTPEVVLRSTSLRF